MPARESRYRDAALRPLSVRVKKLKPGAAGKTILPRNAEMFGVSNGEAPSETDEASSSMDHCSKDHVQYQVRHTFIHFGADVDTRSADVDTRSVDTK